MSKNLKIHKFFFIFYFQNKVYTCNSRGTLENHDAVRLTDNSTDTWWQSESIYSSLRNGRDITKNDVTLTIDLHKVSFVFYDPAIPDFHLP